MEFTLEAMHPVPDLAVAENAIAVIDPSVLIDLDADGRTIRIATVLQRPTLLACLQAAGLAADPQQLRQRPSVCCGGCSG